MANRAQAIHDEPNTWLDRRTHTGHETAETLAGKLNESNWREHPDNQADAVDESLDALGWVGSVKINSRSGRLIDGHLRVKRALLKDPRAEIPVDYYDLTPEEEDFALQVLDASTEMATPNADKLAALMERTREMVADRPALRGMLEALKERAGVNGSGPVKDVPPQIDKAAELQEKWGTALGQLWALGEHRVVCGDCTDRAVVEAVMRGEKADLCVTDPPYGVQYSGGTKTRSSLEGDESPDLYFPMLKLVYEFSNKKAPLYLWHSDSKSAAVSAAVSAAGYEKRCTIIWNKNLAQYGALSAQYKTKHEPCYYLYKSKYSPYWYGPTNEVTVWDIERNSINDNHPTEKPTEVMARPIRNSSQMGDIIFDPFLGSGTTLIAAHQLNRRCRGIEIHPPYVAVTLQRYHDRTGDEPRLVDG